MRTVLDLRSLAEIETGRDAVPEGVEWYHCPLQREQIDAKDITGSAERAFAGSLTDGYLNIVKTNGALLASAVRQLIAGLEKGAVLFHCTAGKDRPEFWHPVFSLSAGFPRKILSQIMR